MGTGHVKLKGVLKLNAGIEVDEIESKRLVKLYREVNHEVVKLWEECDRALQDMASWPADRPSYYLGSGKCLLVEPKGIKLPNGLYITYSNLQRGEDGFEYKSRRGTISIWGGAVVENVVQALARIVIGEQMIQINEKYRPALTVHDAVVCVTTKATAQESLDYIMGIMNTAPTWAPNLPIACEGAYGDSYGGMLIYIGKSLMYLRTLNFYMQERLLLRKMHGCLIIILKHYLYTRTGV